LARDEAERLCQQYREGGTSRFNTLRGLIRDAAARWNPPPAEIAARMVASRFGLFFELKTRAV
jgi:hypothetical protein